MKSGKWQLVVFWVGIQCSPLSMTPIVAVGSVATAVNRWGTAAVKGLQTCLDRNLMRIGYDALACHGLPGNRGRIIGLEIHQNRFRQNERGRRLARLMQPFAERAAVFSMAARVAEDGRVSKRRVIEQDDCRTSPAPRSA